ncbi:helix-turn-helix domain-containing protein [Parasegetibacter sp. MAH-26]|uniref:Helix-turn-helix domain-containing protein n=2 Tax=Pinibacter aurantiacus TaxID=2851599 RepID=A0A9E2SBG8_9BACT|nr:helix-turn-helix domain-containing protein [Pinibacter aurantiacus]
MEVDFITKNDLENFRAALLNDIKGLMQNSQTFSRKEWLKAIEVRKLLGVSNGTLQSMRVKGTLRSSKIGGIHYYRYTDIENLMQQGYALK